jgi:alpha-tubulin suppressor-like RCC1 family protein
MKAASSIIIGAFVLSFTALHTHAQTASSDNTHRALMIAGGRRIVLREDGKVVAFEWPSLGEGPLVIKGSSNITAVVGREGGIALRADGIVLSWTAKCNPNARPECTYSEAKPQPRIAGAIAIASNGEAHMALLRDGSVWGWGDDWRGLISGLPPVRPRERVVGLPKKIPLPVPIESVSVGTLQAMAIDREGHVWTWASLSNPSLRGPGEEFSGPDGFTAVKVAGIPAAKQAAAGMYSVVLTVNNDVWMWGESHANQIRRGSAVPQPVPDFGQAESISASDFNVVAIEKSGVVRLIGIEHTAFPTGDRRTGEFQEHPVELTLAKGAQQVSADISGLGILKDGNVLYGRDELDLGE